MFQCSCDFPHSTNARWRAKRGGSLFAASRQNVWTNTWTGCAESETSGRCSQADTGIISLHYKLRLLEVFCWITNVSSQHVVSQLPTALMKIVAWWSQWCFGVSDGSLCRLRGPTGSFLLQPPLFAIFFQLANLSISQSSFNHPVHFIFSGY
jgi:hypothetical protein